MSPDHLLYQLQNISRANNVVSLVAELLDEFATLASNEPEYSRKVINGASLGRLADTLKTANNATAEAHEWMEEKIREEK